MKSVNVFIKDPSGNTFKKRWAPEKLGDLYNDQESDYFLIEINRDGDKEYFELEEEVWHLWAELISFQTNEQSEFTKLKKFIFESLLSTQDYIDEYLELENAVFEQKLFSKIEYQDLLVNLARIRARVWYLERNLLTVRKTVNQCEYADNSPQGKINKVINSLHEFNTTLSKSIGILSTILSQLKEKSEGKKYSIIGYAKDTLNLKKITKKRRVDGDALTRARQEFFDM